jgi:hypothetical protein
MFVVESIINADRGAAACSLISRNYDRPLAAATRFLTAARRRLPHACVVKRLTSKVKVRFLLPVAVEANTY